MTYRFKFDESLQNCMIQMYAFDLFKVPIEGILGCTPQYLTLSKTNILE